MTKPKLPPFHPKLGAIAFATLLAALNPASSIARDDPMDTAKAAKVTGLTNQLIAAIGEYHRATGSRRSAAAAKLKAAALERRNLLLTDLEAHPGFAFRQALPNGLTAGLPADVRQLLEQEVELEGRITGAWGDNMNRGVSSHTYYLEVDTQTGPQWVRLHAADAPDRPWNRHPADPFVGMTATVRAVQLDGQLVIGGSGSVSTTEGTSTSTSTSGGGGSISGTQKTLVLLGNFKDKALSSTCTPSYVHGQIFAASSSVNDVYREMSNDAVTFAGDVYGAYTMSANSTDSCSFSTWASQLDNLAAGQGINLSDYPRRVYVIPQNSCGYDGYGTYGGSPSRAYMMYCQYTDLYAHELGHNLNFRHATTSGNEYGDTSDLMGRNGLALRHFNAPNKVNAGWIPSTNVRNVTGSGTFTLDATAAISAVNAQVLMIAKPDTNDYYFVSFRQPLGYDKGLAASYQNLVSIHRAPTSTTSPTVLLSTLAAGGTYSDSVNGYQISVSSIGTSSATVNVSMAAPTCTRANPTVSLSPISQSAAPGNSVSYQVTVTNKNNSGCGTSTFSFTPQVPSGWSSSNSPATLSLGAGATASSTWTVTSPSSNVAQQTYAVSSTSYDTAATTTATTVQASYIVTAPDGSPPTVAVTSPSNGSTVSGTVTITASANDNTGVAKVEFWANGKLLGTDTSSPYSIGWNTKSFSGTQTLTAKAFDAAGNSTTSTAVSLTIGSQGNRGGKK